MKTITIEMNEAQLDNALLDKLDVIMFEGGYDEYTKIEYLTESDDIMTELDSLADSVRRNAPDYLKGYVDEVVDREYLLAYLSGFDTFDKYYEIFGEAA